MLPRIIRPKQEIASPSGVLQQLLLLPALPSNSSNLVVVPEQKPVVSDPLEIPQRPHFTSVKGYTTNHQGVGPICRTCYRVVYNNNFTRLYEDNNETCEKLRNMLKQIVRTIDLKIYAEPIICTSCVKRLFECYEFLMKCWDTEVKFNHWVSQRKRVKQDEVNLLILVDSSTDNDELEESIPKTPLEKEVELTDLTTNKEIEQCYSSWMEHSYADTIQTSSRPKKKFKVKLSNTERKRLYRAKKERKRGPFLCELCGYLAKSLVSFSLHLSMHKNNNFSAAEGDHFKCDKCSYTTKNERALKQHAMTHLEPIHKCIDCGKSYKLKTALQSHIKNIHSNNPDCRQCHICGKSFRYSTSLRVHLQTHNPNRPFRYVCEFCGKGFTQTSCHWKHLLTHSNKSYTCELCGKQLKRKSNLRKHFEIFHEKDEKHNCVACKKAFWKTEDLAKHKIKHHTLGYEKKCDICQVYFLNKDKFYSHLVEVHGQLIECEVCGAKMKSQWSLKNHFNIYHGDGGRFKCEICNQAFWKKNSLLNHAVKVHGFQKEQEFTETVNAQGGEDSDINTEHFSLDKENVLVEPIEVLGFF